MRTLTCRTLAEDERGMSMATERPEWAWLMGDDEVED